MDIRTKSLEVGFDKAYEYLDRNPEENLPKLMAMVRKMMPDKEYESKFIIMYRRTTPMNKAELINSVAAAADVSKKEAEAVVSATFDAITAALKDGDKVQLVGFGSFTAPDAGLPSTAISSISALMTLTASSSRERSWASICIFSPVGSLLSGRRT